MGRTPFAGLQILAALALLACVVGVAQCAPSSRTVKRGGDVARFPLLTVTDKDTGKELYRGSSGMNFNGSIPLWDFGDLLMLPDVAGGMWCQVVTSPPNPGEWKRFQRRPCQVRKAGHALCFDHVEMAAMEEGSRAAVVLDGCVVQWRGRRGVICGGSGRTTFEENVVAQPVEGVVLESEPKTSYECPVPVDYAGWGEGSEEDFVSDWRRLEAADLPAKQGVKATRYCLPIQAQVGWCQLETLRMQSSQRVVDVPPPQPEAAWPDEEWQEYDGRRWLKRARIDFSGSGDLWWSKYKAVPEEVEVASVLGGWRVCWDAQENAAYRFHWEATGRSLDPRDNRCGCTVKGSVGRGRTELDGGLGQ